MMRKYGGWRASKSHARVGRPCTEFATMMRANAIWQEPVMTPSDRIEVNPQIMLGKPVIRGTRIPVELILRKLGEGATVGDLLDAYPRISKDDILAVLSYASHVVGHEETIIIEAAGASS
jgi:uncharacterized protein (DUF433 family)